MLVLMEIKQIKQQDDLKTYAQLYMSALIKTLHIVKALYIAFCESSVGMPCMPAQEQNDFIQYW